MASYSPLTTPSSIFPYVAAPAPRLLMRLALIPELMSVLSGNAISRFIEIGPGLGDLSLYLADRFPEAQGTLVDIAENGTEALRERVKKNPRLSVITGDFRVLPDVAAYDLVVACEVFEHIEDDASAFSAVHRMLRPGGYFLFSVPAFMKNWGHADEYAGHHRRYEREQIVSLFKEHGLEIEKVLCYGFPITNMLWFLHQKYYGKKLAQSNLTMEEATKRSGTERTLVRQFSLLPIPYLMAPFFFLQGLVKNKDIGDGYLVLARRP